MRSLKFMITTAVVTLTALVYVHQQVELVKLSYEIETKEKIFEQALDLREGIIYNINDLEAPSRLEKALLAKKIDISFPKRGQVVGVAAQPSRMRESFRRAGVETRPPAAGIFEFLGLTREAQAKER